MGRSLPWLPICSDTPQCRNSPGPTQRTGDKFLCTRSPPKSALLGAEHHQAPSTALLREKLQPNMAAASPAPGHGAMGPSCAHVSLERIFPLMSGSF